MPLMFGAAELRIVFRLAWEYPLHYCESTTVYFSYLLFSSSQLTVHSFFSLVNVLTCSSTILRR